MWKISFLIVLAVFGLSIVLAQSYSQDTQLDVVDPLVEAKRKAKFDHGFYDKIAQKASANELKKSRGLLISNEDAYHEVIFVVDKFSQDGKSLKYIAKQNKDALVNEFTTKFGVKEFYKAERLSFVTAKVPVQDIPKLADYNFVRKIGNGEEKLVPLTANMNEAKSIINATGLPSPTFPYDGKGVNVAIIDTGVNQNPHPDLPIDSSKIAKQVQCTVDECSSDLFLGDNQNHGTRVASIVGGLGNLWTNMTGIASGTKLFNVKIPPDPNLAPTTSRLANGLDWSLKNDADIITVGVSGEVCEIHSAIHLVIDESIDEGLLVINGVGNYASVEKYVQNLACGFNLISVGAVNDNGNQAQITGKGPARFGQNTPDPNDDVGPRIKPELVAPGENVMSADINNYYSQDSGTSFSSPMVAGAAALIKQAKPEFTPLEIKAALLLGAKWKGVVPFTASNYESTPLSIGSNLTNVYGLGLLDIKQTLELVDYKGNGTHILRDKWNKETPVTLKKEYSFSASAGDQVKIILSWLMHPGGTIKNPSIPPGIPLADTYSDFDIALFHSNGTTVRINGVPFTSDSIYQNNEFMIFDAPSTDMYTIKVTAKDISPTGATIEPFVIASTKPLLQVPVTDEISITIRLDDIIIKPNETIVLLDTTGTGSLRHATVSASLPCASSGPNQGIFNDKPALEISAGTLANRISVINSDTDDTGFSGAVGLCSFSDMVSPTGSIPIMTSIMISNVNSVDISIPKGAMVTITGAFE